MGHKRFEEVAVSEIVPFGGLRFCKDCQGCNHDDRIDPYGILAEEKAMAHKV